MFDPQYGFVDPLLAWHERNGRHDLPWRESDRTAFEILLAEILLQRTTAERSRARTGRSQLGILRRKWSQRPQPRESRLSSHRSGS